MIEYTFKVYFKPTLDNVQQKRLFAVLDDMRETGEVSYSVRVVKFANWKSEAV